MFCITYSSKHCDYKCFQIIGTRSYISVNPRRTLPPVCFFFFQEFQASKGKNTHCRCLSSCPTHNTCPSSFKVLSNIASTLAQTLSSVNGGCALYPQASALLHITDNCFYNKHQHNVGKQRTSSHLGSCRNAALMPHLWKETVPILANAPQHSSNPPSTPTCSRTRRLSLLREAARQQAQLHPPSS